MPAQHQDASSNSAPSKLDQLRLYTDVVADTGDIEAIRRFQPLDATTNPSLLLRAAALPAYAKLVEAARDAGRASDGDSATQLADRKSTRLNSSHVAISYAVFCLKKKKKNTQRHN